MKKLTQINRLGLWCVFAACFTPALSATPNSDLAEAVKEGSVGGTKIALDAGASANAKTDGGEPVLCPATGEGSIEIIELLIKAKVNLNIDGKTDPDNGIVSCIPILIAVNRGHIEILKLFLANKINVNLGSKTRNGTALIMAAEEGKVEMVKLLLEAKADVNIVEPPTSTVNAGSERNGGTALMFAARKGHKEIVNLLIGANAKVNLKRKDGKTALKLVENALAGKKDTQYEDAGETFSPEELAALKKNRAEIVELLKAAGAK